MAGRSKRLIFPARGVVRQFGFQDQDPFSTIDACNVRTAGSETGRARGGSRPGLVRAYPTQLGSNPITGSVASATYNGTTGLTRIVSTVPAFAPWMVGMQITFTAPGTDLAYVISAYVNSTTIDVVGDAVGAKTVLLAGGTWPAWVAAGSILTVASVNYTVASRVSDTEIRLANGAVPAVSASAYSVGFTYDTGTVWVMAPLGVPDQVRLSDGVFPSWAADGVLAVGVDSQTVATRDNDTELTLDAPGLSQVYPPLTEYVLTATYNTGTVTSGAFTIPCGRSIQGISSVRPAAGTTAATLLDTFETMFNAQWLWSSPWDGFIPDMFDENNHLRCLEHSGRRYAWAGNLDSVLAQYAGSALGEAITNLDTTKPYVASITMAPWDGQYADATHYIVLRMDNASPSYNDCVVVQAVCTNVPGVWAISAYLNRAGSTLVTSVSATLPVAYPVTLSVHVNGDAISVHFDDVLRFTFTHSLPAGSRFGFAMMHQTYGPPSPIIDEFRLDYSRTAADIDYSRSKLCVIANGLLYVENDAGGFDAVAGDVNLDSVRLIDAVGALGKLWIADLSDEPKFELSDCTIDVDGTGGGAGAGRVLDKAGVDWSTADPDNDVVYVSDPGTGGPEPGVYEIASTDADKLTIANEMTAVNATGGVGVRILRAPKVYDPSATSNQLAIWKTTIESGVPKGIMPTGCPLISLYRGRVVLGGARDNPHVWYMSAIGDPQNFNFDADPNDPSRAIPGTAADMGKIAAPLTALVAYSKDYHVFGCYSELWVMRGDPGYGGTLDNISYGTGIIWRRAWCYLPNGTIAFLSHRGLCVMDPNSSMEPIPLSQDVLPAELLDIDVANVYPILGWDGRYIHIYLVPATQGIAVLSTARHWVYDWDRKAFWPVSIYGAHEPLAVYPYEMNGVAGKTLLLGCRDGYVRRFDADAPHDDQAPINSYVLLGPFTDGMGAFETILEELEGVLGEQSSAVTWTLYTGKSPEAAYANSQAGTASGTGTFTAGRSRVAHPLRRAAAFYLKLSSTSRWEVDAVLAKFWGRVVVR